MDITMQEDFYDSERVLEALKDRNYDLVYLLVKPFAERGVAEAQVILGSLYQLGTGVELSGQTAAYWYTRAADQGNPLAWNNLGTLYSMGMPDLCSDRLRSLECYKRAHSLGFDAMQFAELKF